MPTIRKAIFFSAIILSVVSSFEAQAQRIGLSISPMRQKQPVITQQMHTIMQMEMNRNWRENAGQGDEYIVKFKDGELKTFRSNMCMDTVLHKNFLVFVNKKFKKSDSLNRYQKIYPDQTLSMSAMVINDQGAAEAKLGLPTDTGWTIKVIRGAISIYARSANYLYAIGTAAFGAPRMEFAVDEVIGIQLNDGTLEKLTKENVLKILAGNDKAIELAEKKGWYEAVKKYNRDAENDARK